MVIASNNAEMIEKYTDQPGRMPSEVRERIERLWGGGSVQLYAVADLDERMQLQRQWVALGQKHIAIVTDGDGSGEKEEIKSFSRRRIRKVWESPGLSCTRLTFLDSESDEALGTVRYTHRQRRAFENIKFVVEQGLEGKEVELCDADAAYAASVAEPIKKAQASVAVHRMKVVWRLVSYMKKYRGRLVTGLVMAGLITVVSLLPPYLTGYLVDNVIKPVEDGTLNAERVGTVIWLVIAGIATVYGLRELFMWVRLRTMAILGEYVSRDLRRELYEHLQTLSLSYFSSEQTGGIITRVSSDTDRLWHFMTFGIVDAVLALIMLAGLGTVLVCLDWKLGLIMTVPVPVMIAALLTHSRYMKSIFLKAWRKWSRLTAVLGDTIPGMRVVKAFNQEEYEKRRFNIRNEDATKEFNLIHMAWTRFWPLLMLGLHMTMVLVWVFAVPRVVGDGSGDATLSTGTFISFLLYMGMFMWPIEMIGQTVQMMNRATTSAHRIFEVLDTEPELQHAEDAVKLEPLQGGVVFENVSFAYDSVRSVIKGVSFEVKAGEMIGLVGPSGAGKTTLINLLARFYDVSSGRILIDGVDLRELDTGHYRRQVGMVLQEAFLFHGSIVGNIAYGKPEASLDEVLAASKAANAHDFVCKLPHGYDTVVGERGHTLSGGERQRVSIARAILNDPKILILDEATSSVDTETERKIQEALERLIAGRTVFAIAHRLSTLRKADRLMVIEEGVITEIGTHKELLGNKKGTYTRLCKLQQELHSIYAV